MPLLRSLPGNVTVEMNLRLWAAAQAIRADDPSAETIRSQPVEHLVDLYRQKVYRVSRSRHWSGS